MNDKQPDALRLADRLQRGIRDTTTCDQAADKLRHQWTEIEQHKQSLEQMHELYDLARSANVDLRVELDAARAQPAQAESVTYWQRGTTLPAQAVPLLSDAELVALWQQQGGDVVCNFGRAIEQAVLAKVGIVGKEGA